MARGANMSPILAAVAQVGIEGQRNQAEVTPSVAVEDALLRRSAPVAGLEGRRAATATRRPDSPAPCRRSARRRAHRAARGARSVISAGIVASSTVPTVADLSIPHCPRAWYVLRHRLGRRGARVSRTSTVPGSSRRGQHAGPRGPAPGQLDRKPRLARARAADDLHGIRRARSWTSYRFSVSRSTWSARREIPAQLGLPTPRPPRISRRRPGPCRSRAASQARATGCR